MSSDIDATLLEEGKTAHSLFKLLLNLMRVETLICNITIQSNILVVQVLIRTLLLKDYKLMSNLERMYNGPQGWL